MLELSRLSERRADGPDRWQVPPKGADSARLRPARREGDRRSDGTSVVVAALTGPAQKVD